MKTTTHIIYQTQKLYKENIHFLSRSKGYALGYHRHSYYVVVKDENDKILSYIGFNVMGGGDKLRHEKYKEKKVIITNIFSYTRPKYRRMGYNKRCNKALINFLSKKYNMRQIQFDDYFSTKLGANSQECRIKYFHEKVGMGYKNLRKGCLKLNIS